MNKELTYKIGHRCIVSIMACTILSCLLVNYSTSTYDDFYQTSQWLMLYKCSTIGFITIGIMYGFYKKTNCYFPQTICWCIIAAGTIEAINASCQLYGLVESHHLLYKLTGSFYNPGPLGGYIAACIPVGFAMYRMSTKTIKKITLGALIIMVLIEPPTMSRGGWISAIIGSLYVFISTSNIFEKIKHANRKKTILIAITLLTLATATVIGLWHIKSDSALGRLFIWKISCKAIAQSPIYGHNSFVEIFGNTQESYFSNGGSESEKIVAGSPDYAFNEYLHYSILWGIPIVIAITALIILSIIVGHRHKQYGICGGLISLGTFAFTSYPAHIPSFMALFIILIIGCWANSINNKIFVLFLLSASIGTWILYKRQYSKVESLKKWEKIHWYYDSKSFYTAADLWGKIEKNMDWHFQFMLQYGNILHGIKEYEHSNSIFEKAQTLTNDPTILNHIGVNHQALGNYREAEKYFLRSLNRLPERVYPHYLLFLLYSEKEYYNETLRQKEADIILNHKWKVESSATREIRENVKKTLHDYMEPYIKK